MAEGQTSPSQVVSPVPGMETTSPTPTPQAINTPTSMSDSTRGAGGQQSIWEQLRHSHTVWGYIYRLGAPPISLRTSREIFANDPAANEAERFVDNRVVTSRYTWYNFVPLFLFQQFSRFANFYFLIVCIIQAIPEVSITNGIPSSALPLAFVLFFDGVTLRNGSFQEIEWKDVKVGDIVKVMKGDEFPADLLFLASEHEDPEQCGVCHVQTAQLDGETNLKIRNAHERTVPLFRTDEDCARFRGRLVCEEPHENFAKFNGTLFLDRESPKGLAMDANATLLRGCVLKNVISAKGLVVYTGRETKVRVKQSAVVSKKASIEKEINRYIIALIILQLVLCVIGAVGYYIWGTEYGAKSWYLQVEPPTGTETIARFFTFFLLISNIIPISLYVTMKLARTAQKFFMDKDAQMIYRDEELYAKSGGEEGVYPLKVRSMDLNDELGQISHIFSDKTGTLTSNYMEFRKLTVNGVIYGRGTTEIGMARRRRLGLDVVELERLMADNSKVKRELPHVNYIEGSESHPGHSLRGEAGDLTGEGARRDPAQAEALRLFLLNMCLNHTVVIEHVQDRVTKDMKSQLSASSPDEEAFVLAGQFFGCTFVGRQKDIILLNVFGKECQYKVLVVIAYSSARQMMSVVVEDLQPEDESRKYILFSKGSDARTLQLNVTATGRSTVPQDVIEQQTKLISRTKAQLLEMAEDGLRTLVFSFRYVPPDELLPWLERYEQYLGDINEKRARDNKLPNKIDETAAEMEKNLLLQGASANEDKLQEEVPESIALLASAGVKIYMLTGDKQETAINIGYAARMLTNEFVRVLITSEELYCDKLQEDIAKTKNSSNQQKAEAAGLTLAEWVDRQSLELPQVAERILEINARVKLRKYANVASAKIFKNQEFTRPRSMVIDELVMNMIWPSVPKMGKVTLSTLRDVYKDVASLVARAQALTDSVRVMEYREYSDSQWADAESEILDGLDMRTFRHDDELQASISQVLLQAGLPNLLAPGGLDHLAEPVRALLKVRAGMHHGSPAESETIDVTASLQQLSSQLDAIHTAAKKIVILHGKDMQKDLLVVAESCKSVIACRCRPDQKKKMLELIRYNVSSSRCLAVGDGANDVDMIQAAHVGVGIVGPEGVQAANASDYALGRFKFLARLLLVHGRWNYNRMSLLVCYMFYKNLLYAFCQMLYTVIAAWSGQKFYVEAANQTFNLVYTGLPILVAAVLDKDVNADNAVRFPYLYSDGLFRRRLNIGVLLWWLATGIYEATLLFVFAYFGSYYSSHLGGTPYIFEFGTWVITALIVVVNVRLALNVNVHSWLFILAVALSVAIWWVAAYIMDAFDADGMQGGMSMIFGNGGFWLWLLVFIIASQLHVMFTGQVRRYFTPEYRDLVQEYEVLSTPAGKQPTRYQRCCTCGLKRFHTIQRRSPAQLLAIAESKLRVPSHSTAHVAEPPNAEVVDKLVVQGHNKQHFDSVLVSDLIRALEVDFGPDLNNLGMGSHPAARFMYRTEWHDMHVAEDMADELVEWPLEQRMRVSLMMKRSQLYEEAAKADVKGMEHPEVHLRRVKLQMLCGRLSSLIEHGLTSDADDTTATVVTVEVAPTRAEPAAITAAPEITPAAVRIGEFPEAAPPAPVTHHVRRRSGTDFSVDERSSHFYGDAFSTLGRRVTSTTRVTTMHNAGRSEIPESAVHETAAGLRLHPRAATMPAVTVPISP